MHDPDNDADNQPDRPAADSPEHREREQGADIRASFTCEGAGDNLRGGDQYADVSEDKEEADERCQGRSKDAPLLWAAQRKYEERHEKGEVRADEEMDVGV